VGSNPLLIGEAQQVEYLKLIGGDLMELRFDPRTFGFDTMLNYNLSQKLKSIGRNKSQRDSSTD
jgi:hypothetical protein